MNTESQENALQQKYTVVSVEKAEPPEGMPGNNWHRYVIGRGTSRIEGYKPGTLKAVTKHAEECAEDLNARAFKGYSAYAPRNKKK
jgi:hypothetical protein